MILITKTSDNKSFFQFSEEHWKRINPYSEKMERYYIVESLVGRIETKRDEHILNGNHNQSNFYTKLLENNNSLLKRIVVSHVDNYPDLIKEIEISLTNYGLFPLNNPFNFGAELDSVFNYDNWRINGKGVNFFTLMGIEVCPYCNLVIMNKEEERGIAVASFDHFYDQASYPYLSLSFYNIIPVCKICNETYKGAIKFTISSYCHPYSDDFDENVEFKSNYFEDCPDYRIEMNYKKNINNRFSNFSKALSFNTEYNSNNVKKYSEILYNWSHDYDSTKKSSMMAEYPGITLKEIEKNICKKIDVPYEKEKILNHQFGKLKRDLSKNYNLITTEQ
jgi:hypothetical protein